MPEHSPQDSSTSESAALILVVDDEQLLRELISLTLTDFNVSTATNGLEAIDLLKTGKYEMVITDLMMPEGDGFAILEAVRDLQTIPDVLVMTGYPSTENEQRCRQLGCWDVLAKPFAVSHLRQIVGECIAHRQEQRSRSDESDGIGKGQNP